MVSRNERGTHGIEGKCKFAWLLKVCVPDEWRAA